jgi:hypothetical protein
VGKTSLGRVAEKRSQAQMEFISEEGPALQKADAQPTELRRTLTELCRTLTELRRTMNNFECCTAYYQQQHQI